MTEDRLKSREEHDREIRRSLLDCSEEGALPELDTEDFVINMGPSHPATHGTVRFLLRLDGEIIKDVDPDIGYLHRWFEKQCENATWTKVFPYTDRLNYVSPICNNVGYALAVEKLAGIRDPSRSRYLRVIGSEIHRVCDHLTALAATTLELGAFTAFLYCVEARELYWDRVTELTGARMTVSWCRIGGVSRDAPDGWLDLLRETGRRVAGIIDELDLLLTRNRIFIDRMQGTGVISKEDAVELGWTGPCLRACGVDYDVRKDHPYLVYEDLDFDVPVGEHGDNYDRYLVRIEEMRQSLRIIDQCIERMPSGPVILDDWRFVLPPKEAVYGTIQGTIAHFEHIMYGVRVPRGEAYGYTEAANGELGFYVVSDGSGRPYKVKVRPPCFALMQGLPEMMRGSLLADLIPTFDSINMIGGEIDR